MEDKIKGHIHSVGKALRILNLLGENKREMSLGEIAKTLGFSKPTVHSLLSTMCHYGYVKQYSSDSTYWLGTRLFELGNSVGKNWEFRKIALPHMEKLKEEIQETIQMGVLDNGDVLYIEKRECTQSLRVVSDIGGRLPAHCTGLGKVLLAHLTMGEVNRIISNKGLPKFTKHTITDPVLLEKELSFIKSQGYAIDNEEIMVGLCCIAAPITDYQGRVVAALSISGPVGRLKSARRNHVLTSLLETTKNISQSISS